MTVVSMSQWPLTGRDAELQMLASAWQAQGCRGVVVAGAAGVGKTRLAEEFLAGAGRGRIRCAEAIASRAAAAVPLGAIAHLIPAGVDLSDPVRAFTQVASQLAGPDGSRRWALMVDDLHLLDTTSSVLLRQLMDAGVARLIATLRTGEPVNEAAGALLAGDTVHRVDLAMFTLEQVEVVLQGALAGPVARRTVHDLLEASEGNALYLRELVVGALADGSLAWDGELWQLAEDRSRVGTPRLAELIEARLAHLEPPAREVLELLAVCEPVPLADAAAQADLAVLTGLEKAGRVRVVSDRRRTALTLAHPLYGEALRASLPEPRRRRLLLVQADRIREHGARRRDDPLHIAAWQLTATGTADPAQLVQAAALARYAHDYPQALTLLDALPEHEHTTATRLMLGEVLFEVGQPDRADHVLARADAHAQGEGEVVAVTIARTFNVFEAVGIREALAVNDAARARVASEQGLRMLDYSEASLRIALGQPERALALLEDLGEDAADTPDLVVWLTAATFKPFALEMLGRCGEAVEFAERAYQTHLAVSDRVLYVHPAMQLSGVSWALAAHGRINDALAVGERGYAELTEAHILVPRLWMALILGRIECLAGHPVAARRWYAEGLALARAHGSITPMALAITGVAACAAMLGDTATARQALAQAPPSDHFDVRQLKPLASAWLAAASGEQEQARTVLAVAAADARDAGLATLEALHLTEIARLGGAGEVADRLAELAQQCDGTLAPARAHFAAALAADDPDQLLAAADELQTVGADLLAAEAAAAAAAAYHAAGRTRRATAATHQATACTARCGEVHTPLLTTARAPEQLTARERDIAQLAARGTSSRDIAAALHLSVRTVENHLQHAYTKLGVTTRLELADVLGTRTTSA
jgi:DNA-binding NarL/FixJ family response regulator